MRGNKSNLAVEARVLNAFNTQTVTSTNSTKFTDLNTINAPPYIAAYAVPNPLFSTPNGYAIPRRILLSGTVSF